MYQLKLGHAHHAVTVIDELTDSQKLEIAEAEKQGQNVVLITRDDS
ncbi:MAG TPA: hypothetical protein VIO39_01920 [Methylotenera sp.]|jgi:hypothetical protein